jgi:hypothetical protein
MFSLEPGLICCFNRRCMVASAFSMMAILSKCYSCTNLVYILTTSHSDDDDDDYWITIIHGWYYCYTTWVQVFQGPNHVPFYVDERH